MFAVTARLAHVIRYITRLVVIYLRGRRLAAGSAASTAAVPAGARA
jgi:hypothetical protein